MVVENNVHDNDGDEEGGIGIIMVMVVIAMINNAVTMLDRW